MIPKDFNFSGVELLRLSLNGVGTEGHNPKGLGYDHTPYYEVDD